MTHRTVRRNLYEFMNETLETSDRVSLEKHLSHCQECSAELASLREAVRVIPQRSLNPSQQRPELFWQFYAEKVERRIGEQVIETSAGFIPDAVRAFFASRSGFIGGFASAMAVMLIVFGVWSLLRTANGERSALANHQQALNVERVALRSRAYDYLDRSKVLLLGFVNMDAEDLRHSGLVLKRQREVSKELVRESKELSGALNDPSQRQLKDLIGDLEVILLQIANLESNYDSPAVEILRNGVDRKGILLKINLEEIDRSERSKQSKTDTQNKIKKSSI